MSCPDYAQLTLNCYRLTIFGKIVCDFDPSLLFKAPWARSAHTHTQIYLYTYTVWYIYLSRWRRFQLSLSILFFILEIQLVSSVCTCDLPESCYEMRSYFISISLSLYDCIGSFSFYTRTHTTRRAHAHSALKSWRGKLWKVDCFSFDSTFARLQSTRLKSTTRLNEAQLGAASE